MGELEDQRITDSIIRIDSIRNSDSLITIKTKKLGSQDKLMKNYNKSQIDTNKFVKHESSLGKFIKELGRKFFLPLFYADNFNLTGFGIVIFNFSNYIKGYGIINAYLLILLSCALILIKKLRNLRTILVIDILGFLFLLFSKADLWGYWVCLYCWIGLIFLGLLLIYKQKNIKS